jgi:hypothetical protein
VVRSSGTEVCAAGPALDEGDESSKVRGDLVDDGGRSSDESFPVGAHDET